MLNNKLTQREQELLVITMEECCELSMVCSKLLRFGKEEKHIEDLLQESADVTVMINLLSDYKLVSHMETMEQPVLNQNLKNARDDVTQGRLTLLQAMSKWDVTSRELVEFIINQHDKEQTLKEKRIDNTI